MPYKDKAKQKQYNRDWYLRNQKSVRERLQKWRKDNGERYAKSTKAWREANHDRILAQHRAYNESMKLVNINARHDERMRVPFPVTVY